MWSFSGDDRTYELLWARVGNTLVSALYHPPRPLPTADSLLDYIEACLDELFCEFPYTSVVLAGGFNQLDDNSIVERTGFAQLVQQPTRVQNILDRIFMSCPMYESIRVVTPVMRSDHKAVVAYAGHLQPTVKATTKKVYRAVTPAQHALFLQYISTLDFDISHDPSTDAQSLFDHFYETALQLLNSFHPERTVTVTTRDPDYMSHIDSKVNANDMWAAYRQLTGRKQQVNVVDGITAESLNQHYAAISTDTSYQPPPCKHTAAPNVTKVVSEWRMFIIFDNLCATATGLDQLPSWFQRLGAPLFYKPLTHLFNVSVSDGVISHQWKAAFISAKDILTCQPFRFSPNIYYISTEPSH